MDSSTRATMNRVLKRIRLGKELTEEDRVFSKRNSKLFENIRFKKVRRAEKKWRELTSAKMR